MTEDEAALTALEQASWGQKFPIIVAVWRRAYHRDITFFAIPPTVRRVINITNAIESISSRLSRIIRTPDHFPSDEAAAKLI